MPKVTKELSVWFEYPDDPFGGRVLVRHLKQGQLDAIMERTREIKNTYIKEFRQTESVIRLCGAKVETAIAAIADWENFFDENDKPIDPTPANIKIMCLEGGFNAFIEECLSILAKKAEDLQKAETKN